MLQPTINKGVREKLEQRQQRQKCQYDKQTKPLPVLKHGDTVRHRASQPIMGAGNSNLPA